MITASIVEPLLDPALIPRHVAIIMDGNRRWAQNQALHPVMGHRKGADTLTEIVRAAVEWGIKTLTIYAFSTENWSRSQVEIDALMHLFELYLLDKREMLLQKGINLNAIGDLARLPSKIQESLLQTIAMTRSCQRMNLVVALNYGGRDEIRRSVRRILAQKISYEEITEELIAQHLDTAAWGDPDLLIRTGGEFRLSNFMLWQLSYAEIYVTDVFWPEFTPPLFFQALLTYQKRQRRFGGSS
jgi:undecaprenyl diphosphate synthase